MYLDESIKELEYEKGVLINLRYVILYLLIFASILFSSNWKFFYEISFEGLIDKLLKYRVIYLGEVHDKKEIHELQLKIIKALYQRDKRLVITMEMFQQPFQEYIDLYIEGEIDEKEMLEKTQYKKRWGISEELYRDIWKFAKRHGIKLYALNVPFELLKEVRSKGLENIKSVYLPPRIIFPDEEYRKFLIEQMKKHEGKFDEKRFIDIQTAWDNGMAYKILKLMVLYPDHRIVVIVGKGHLYKGYGIPFVLKRLYPKVRQAILYPVEDEKFYFLFSKDFSNEYSSTNSIRLPN